MNSATQGHSAEVDAWDRGMAAIDNAKRLYQTYYDETWKPAQRATDAAIKQAGLPYIGTPAQIEARRRIECETCPDWEGINDRIDALCAAESDAVKAVIDMPAPHEAGLLWKLEFLFGEEARAGGDGDRQCPAWRADYVDAVMADARRLLGGEAPEQDRPADGLAELLTCTEDFEVLLNMEEAKVLAERWSDARPSAGITMAFASINRADMVGALRQLVEGEDGEDALVETITAVTTLVEQTKSFVQLFETVQARLFIASAEMIERGAAEKKGAA